MLVSRIISNLTILHFSVSHCKSFRAAASPCKRKEKSCIKNIRQYLAKMRMRTHRDVLRSIDLQERKEIEFVLQGIGRTVEVKLSRACLGPAGISTNSGPTFLPTLTKPCFSPAVCTFCPHFPTVSV